VYTARTVGKAFQLDVIRTYTDMYSIPMIKKPTMKPSEVALMHKKDRLDKRKTLLTQKMNATVWASKYEVSKYLKVREGLVQLNKVLESMGMPMYELETYMDEPYFIEKMKELIDHIQTNSLPQKESKP
jgi:hypothetical protein